MIFDSIENLKLYEKSFPSLKTVSKILSSEDLSEKPCGSYTTEDPNCRYNICEYQTTEDSKEFEIHKNEADIQIMLTGEEIMTSSARNLSINASPYDKDKDIHFVSGPHIIS